MWHSYRARWRGTEYAASPDPRPDAVWVRLRVTEPAEGFEEVEPGCFVRPVPAGECESISFVTTVCEWRGAPFQVRDRHGDTLLLEYVGGLLPVARELELERIERGVHRRWVPGHEVTDLRENVVFLEP
ncbi:hypothetical protein AB0D67_13625 [Streptosporangium sp. NPDC048047]|uniref:hypothetical protein n=1 Tax=Streptosporangium sp. NPDC048047 TaxID=3155748 RepID=UPI00342AA80F